MPVLEQYVRLFLADYSHTEVRERLSESQLKIIDGTFGIDLSALWKELREKPEIQQLLTGEEPIPDPYGLMSAEQLRTEAERATQDIYSATRSGALMIYAPSGWGKSRLLGRSVCFEYAKDKIGTVVLDVVGGTIDNALDKIARHKPVAERTEIGSRIRYCNMSGERVGGDVFVTGWPMLNRRYPYESLHTT